ncbi:unnamed protein product [Ceratitis capitata]|uniref:(Mediterranean fruit fly) hypothetical protein n=1 Tax=Ceratitis capitata TaxID=7213 RepID=A0A811VC02_CERCA|nr:unnamed protein product [Ceratitis capitata]
MCGAKATETTENKTTTTSAAATQQQHLGQREVPGAGVRPDSLGAEAPPQIYDVVHAKPAAAVLEEEYDEDDVDVVVVTGKVGPRVQITHAKTVQQQHTEEAVLQVIQLRPNMLCSR